MCEKRIRKIKRGSHLIRLREARRQQRLAWTPTPITITAPQPDPRPMLDKVAQNRVILELAWKTVALMQKNRLIQQKIVALQKETTEFVATVMSNPENRKRYLEHVRLYRAGVALFPTTGNRNLQIKIEPKE